MAELERRMTATDPQPEDQPTAAPAGAADAPRRRIWRILGVIGSLTLLGVAIAVLVISIRDIDPGQLSASLAAASLTQLGLAAFFTALSYLFLTGYDVLALRQIRAMHIGYGTAAFASFTSYAISFTLGFPLITAGAVRFWVYAPKGLTPQKIASLTLIAAVTFWLGMGLVMGFSLLTRPEAIAEVNRLPVLTNMVVGGLIILAAIAYFAWVAARPRQISFQGWRLSLPSWRVTIGQMALGVADVCAGGAVLYVLLPADAPVSFAALLAVYVLGHILGIASHVPGGIGAFEATMLLAFGGVVPTAQLLSAILIYRIIYYLVPFALAVAMLGLGEVRRRVSAFRERLGSGEEDVHPP
jgi:uncharacterized membrane protein YbhN (UPF0104 family)